MPIQIQKRATVWDVVVVGSGATGGWAAYQLGKHRLNVLVLDAGPDEMDAPGQSPEFATRALRMFDRVLRRRRVQSRHHAYWELNPRLFVLDREHPYETPPGKDFQWIRTRSVNGRLLTWGGVGIRTSDHEFNAPLQDGFGAPWPFGYKELHSHFDDVDDFFPVYGERDGLSSIPDGKYVGAARLTEAERELKHTVRTAFGRAAVSGRGVLIRPSARPNGEAAPPSPLREAMRKFGVSLCPNAVVSHVLVGPEGKASGVAFVDRLTKGAQEVQARVVVVCASAIESARILLNSRSRHHPQGLGNSSGTLGCYLMDHPGVAVTGFAPGRRDEVWSDGYGGPKNVMIPRFHNLTNRADGAFLRGYGTFGMLGRLSAKASDCDADEVPFALVSHGEMLPRIENHISLHPDKRDAWGVPTLRIDCAYSDNERALQTHMAEELKEMIASVRGRVTGTHYYPPGGFVHEMGTARMGADARTSVLNGYAQCWDARNVFVMDGAAWPSGAWQNPTFTMMAIAGRASAHLVQELKAGRI
ncbi:GMC family oxidoreductase [Bradyrhizobium sp. 200]|uniref:GMC oxidoreductase n=1 Tax=Bradyrhizobium sp. 200 TaxID=2782665 RepID=UPI001FFE54E9|nr:GMC family oxidoreductase [Bradyrhizobium sp. 200]UPJ51694.1 GMC family oxidoreductase [Bradyrhizobium sp. 200]